MPLLRLTSLIVATLLVAALSALVPGTRNPSISLADQSPASPMLAPAVLAARAGSAPWTRVQASSARTPFAQELAQLSGQSIPGAGQ